MSSKKTKIERILEQEITDQERRNQKKIKQKKKKKKQYNHQQLDDAGPQDRKNKEIRKANKEKIHSIENGAQQSTTTLLFNNNIPNTYAITTPSPKIDPITQQLSHLAFSPQLTPSIAACQLISQNLQQLTINLYEKMIMKSSLITEVIQLAKKQLLTPKQYMAIDYTNKLMLIKQVLIENGQVKYGVFVNMIQEEVNRVQGLILKCIDDVRLFDEVLMDLKKNNIEWEINMEL